MRALRGRISPDDAVAATLNLSPLHPVVGDLYRLSNPGLVGNLNGQLRYVWITESRLCSLEESAGTGPRGHYERCEDDYLKRQLELLPHAHFVAFGVSKAQRSLKRMRDLGVQAQSWHEAHALAPRKFRDARRSWAEALEGLPRLE